MDNVSSGKDLHRIVIMGGGAGGFELATRLGDKLGRKGLASERCRVKIRRYFCSPLDYGVSIDKVKFIPGLVTGAGSEASARLQSRALINEQHA